MGGTAGSGSNATASTVELSRGTATAQSIIVTANGGQAGNVGTAISGGGGGAAGSVPATTTVLNTSLGVYNGNTGTIGSNGGFSAIPTNATYGTTNITPLLSGAGGGGDASVWALEVRRQSRYESQG